IGMINTCTDDPCVDANSDRTHCGGCGTSCASEANCISGVCVCQNACDPGFTPNPTTCQCECGEGLVECAGVCTDLTSDPSHCGVCGRQCTSKFPDCSNGDCVAL